MHIGTGNYHPITARLYTDLGLLTCDEGIGADATELFNYLTTGVNAEPQIQKAAGRAVVSQKSAPEKNRPRGRAAHGSAQPGQIQFKMNALEDVEITRALYRAAQAGACAWT